MIKLIQDNNAALKHFQDNEAEFRRRINYIIDNGISIEKTTYIPVGSDFLFLDELLEQDNLKQLITAQPDKLGPITRLLRRKTPELYDTESKLYFIIYNIFISTAYKKFDKYEFVKTIGTDTCSYCNRNYIYYLDRASNVKPEIDHFFPKDIHPILGMSYFNLIPSCESCNGLTSKRNLDPIIEKLTNPYMLNDSDFLFTFKLVSSHILTSAMDKSSIEVIMKKKLDGHLKAFHLDKLYAKHSDHILELIIKSKVKYNRTYRRYLQTYRNNGLRLTDSEIDRMILGNYALAEEMHLRPFTKLYQDIGKELGLIKP